MSQYSYGFSFGTQPGLGDIDAILADTIADTDSGSNETPVFAPPPLLSRHQMSPRHQTSGHRYKKEEFVDNLDEISKFIDNKNINPGDFEVCPQDIRELNEIIREIIQLKCQHKKFEEDKEKILMCRNKGRGGYDVLSEDEIMKKQNVVVQKLTNVAERYVDKIIEILEHIAKAYKNRVCRVLLKLQRLNCKNLPSVHEVFSSVSYFDDLIKNINISKNSQEDTLTETVSLFNGACCESRTDQDVMCPKEECSKINATVINNVINKNINLHDLLDSELSCEEVHIKKLANEVNYFSMKYTDAVQKFGSSLKNLTENDLNNILQLHKIDGCPKTVSEAKGSLNDQNRAMYMQYGKLTSKTNISVNERNDFIRCRNDKLLLVEMKKIESAESKENHQRRKRLYRNI